MSDSKTSLQSLDALLLQLEQEFLSVIELRKEAVRIKDIFGLRTNAWREKWGEDTRSVPYQTRYKATLGSAFLTTLIQHVKDLVAMSVNTDTATVLDSIDIFRDVDGYDTLVIEVVLKWRTPFKEATDDQPL
jgi:uncharacterized protein (UPF0305 family)